jgi:phytoene/squalene synthetase
MELEFLTDAPMAAAITRAASKQTYSIVRFLVDKDRVDEAYSAYAYFRWVDDYIDQKGIPRAEALAFVKRQQSLMDSAFRGQLSTASVPEEHLLADLIATDAEQNSGLQTYIRNMMAVMAFDATRRGRPVSRRELNEYTRWLAVAVTEALHYFIGHDCASPHDGARYLAATGAHIAHMLRDARDDTETGYFNIPHEVLSAHGISPQDIDSKAYRNWVKQRIHRAHTCFRAGRDYLAKIENLRCRVAGYAYMRRFELVLDCIEREGCLLRNDYPERKGLRRRAEMIGWALWMAVSYRRLAGLTRAWPARQRWPFRRTARNPSPLQPER